MRIKNYIPAAIVAAGTIACTSLRPVPVPIMPAVLGPVDSDHNKAKDFSRVFCSTLAHTRDGNNHSWGDCEKYLEPAVAPAPGAQPAPAAIPQTYRFLFVSGFGADCIVGARAFSTSIAHLKDAHKIDVEYFSVAPYGSGEENGKSIARHIDDGRAEDDQHKYVLIGYDKGASDLLDALRMLDDRPTKVAALVSIAGTIGGTWVTEYYRQLLQPARPWMDPTCPGNVQDGLLNLKRDVRQRFLRENAPGIPEYSIVATSTLDDTSSVLRPAWKSLSEFSAEEDGLMNAWESVLPSAKFLGTMKADHWAVALPFDAMPQPPKGIDRNRYPRDALFESIVRFVITDLAAATK